MTQLDNRYSISREWAGYPEPRFVARFSGDWIGQAETARGARNLAVAHRERFCETLGIPA